MTPTSTSSHVRRRAEERREQVIEAAVREFAEAGYAAASTAAIAARAGISQPYIYALFPSKRDLFLAAHDRVLGRIRATFREAARAEPDPWGQLHKTGVGYPELIASRYELLFQLQSYAAAADPEIRPHVARSFRALADDVARMSGASPRELAVLLATGTLASVTTILELPELSSPLWEEQPDGPLQLGVARPEVADRP